MSELHTVRDVIALWPVRPDLVRDLNAQRGMEVTLDRIHKWAQSGVIPSPYHAGILRAAEARGFALTAADLARIHDVAGKAA